MKSIPFSLCTGVVLLGSIACGNASNTGSGIPTGGSGSVPVGTGGTGSNGPGPIGNGGSGSGLNIDPGSSGGKTSGPNSCQPGSTTTISGVVMDPAGKNPLYNISVYVADPAAPLPDLEKIPVSCGCTQLLPEKVLAIGNTDATGHFEIPCAPSGNVTLVVQTGKWRRKYENVNVVANQANVIPNLRLPANSSEGSLPNIAISTGGSDSFECLPLRIGVSESEYVAGSATGGHIHIYTGLRGATPAQGAVDSYSSLWDSQAHLNEHDVVILSCEGAETSNGPATGIGNGATLSTAVQQNLMNYANAGGRVFASHYQYAWFNRGPFNTGANKLATWIVGNGWIGTDTDGTFPAEVNTTLNGGAAFPGGTALAKWLGVVHALDSNNQLPVRYVRNNVSALSQPPSTEWLHLAASVTAAPNASQYFSADTPIGSDKVCGRVVYSALHVSGGPGKSDSGKLADADYPEMAAAGGAPGTGTGGAGGRTGGGMMNPPAAGPTQGGTVPSGCAKRPLTPQELALEYMFFDLSSCLVPVGEEPPVIPK